MKFWFAFLVAIEVVNAGWIRAYENNELYGWAVGRSVRETFDGGYVVAGTWTTYPSFDSPNMNIWLIKTDAEGDSVWARVYDSGYQDEALCVRQTTDSGYIIAGYTNGDWMHEAGDVWLLKTDKYGDTLWSKVYGSKYGYSKAYWVEQTSDGGYIVTGYYEGAYLWLIKTDENGDTVWAKTYDWGAGSDAGRCVRQTKDSCYIVTCRGLFKTNNKGDSLWLKPWPGGEVEQTTDGGYIIPTGHDYNLWLIKTDEHGDTLWTRTYGDKSKESGVSCQETRDGGYIILGQLIVSNPNGYGENYDIWLLKTDANGDTLWTRAFGMEHEVDKGYSVQETSDGGYIITGVTTSYGNGSGDLLLIKTDSLGYVGVEEPVPVTHQPDWEVVNPIGREVVLRYHDKPGGFHAKIYDISGKKCDECNVNLPSSSIRWGQNVPRGVYFIREESEHHPTIQKVILIR